MKAIQIRVLGFHAPKEPCEGEVAPGIQCGASTWREAVAGELVGHKCLVCGHSQIGEVDFGEVKEIDIPIGIHPQIDGSVTLDLNVKPHGR